MKTIKSITLASFVTLLSTATSVFGGSHAVKSGETLWSISQRYKVSVLDIKKANELADHTIKLNQVLVIPDKSIEVSTAINKQSQVTQHSVVKGDSLWKIAKRYGLTVATLKANNNLQNDTITLGQVLVVSGQKQVAEKQSSEVVADKKKQSKVGSIKQEAVPEKAVPEKQVNPAMKPLPEPVSTTAKDQSLVDSEQSTSPENTYGLAALSEKQQAIVRQQILLDRNGMGPGVIDGYTGGFTTSSLALAETNRPNALTEDTALIVETTIPAAVLSYINADLPGTGKRPDFKQATKDRSLLMYKTALEMLSERYHCSEKLLAKMNPAVDFSNPVVGSMILVPNVSEFKIEDFMTPEGKAITYRYVRKTRRATSVDIDYGKKRMMVWHHDELLASFPVTTNIEKGPTTQRSIESITPAPVYFRKKTELDLRSGPNSPVGIVWAKLGDGFGIHGTSDGSGNGYNTSSGCIRLSNWDMAIFVKLVPANIKVNFLKDGVTLGKVKHVDLAVK